MKKQNLLRLLILLTFFSSYSGMAQKGYLSQITDKDGYTYIRKDPNINSQIIDTIKENVFFYCTKSNIDWYSVTILKKHKSGYRINGFMHKSRIEIIEEQNNEKQKAIIQKIFENYKIMGIELNNLRSNLMYNNGKWIWKSKNDSIKSQKLSRKHSDYSQKYFSPILNILSKYFLQNKRY